MIEIKHRTTEAVLRTVKANTLTSMFRDHACWACRNGELPCREKHPRNCSNPRAKND